MYEQVRILHWINSETVPIKIITGIVQRQDDRCLARAVPGGAAIFRADFHRAQGLIQAFVLEGLRISFRILAMA